MLTDVELERAIRTDAPAIDAAFEEELRSKLFERPRRRSRRRRLLWTGAGMAAAAATALVAVVLAGSGESRPATQEAVPASGSGSATAPSPAAASAGSLGASGASGREVQRSASLSLLVPRGHVQAVADRVVQVVEGAGGVVQASSVSTGDGAPGQATFSLQLPSNTLDSSISALSSLGHVSSLTQSAQDITGSVSAARARLAADQLRRRRLLDRLAAATSAAQVTAIRSALAAVNAEISVDSRALAALQRQAGYATVQVTIADGQTGLSAPGSGGNPLTPAGALGTARDVLAATAAVLLVGAATLAPAALVCALLGWLWARSRRRRREQALGAV